MAEVKKKVQLKLYSPQYITNKYDNYEDLN